MATFRVYNRRPERDASALLCLNTDGREGEDCFAELHIHSKPRSLRGTLPRRIILGYSRALPFSPCSLAPLMMTAAFHLAHILDTSAKHNLSITR